MRKQLSLSSAAEQEPLPAKSRQITVINGTFTFIFVAVPDAHLHFQTVIGGREEAEKKTLGIFFFFF